jgi:hypothetical protein
MAAFTTKRIDAVTANNCFHGTMLSAGRKDFLPVEPQSALSFLFLLGAPRFANTIPIPSVWLSPDLLPPPRMPLHRPETRCPVCSGVEHLQTWEKNQDRLEVVLVNSHDKSSAYQLRCGLFRLVCANGMVVSDGTFQRISIKHSGFDPDSVIEASFKLLCRPRHHEQSAALSRSPFDRCRTASCRYWRGGLSLGRPHQSPGKSPHPPYPRRYGDGAKNLWTTGERIKPSLETRNSRYEDIFQHQAKVPFTSETPSLTSRSIEERSALTGLALSMHRGSHQIAGRSCDVVRVDSSPCEELFTRARAWQVAHGEMSYGQG